jgi:ribonuclease P protein component
VGDARLRRCARLSKKADFNRVFAQPNKSAERFFTVLARPSMPLAPARLGLAVSSKVARSAVARNRIKRLIRESFRQHQQVLKGLDVVVIARPAAVQQDNLELFAALRQHWLKLSELCAKS